MEQQVLLIWDEVPESQRLYVIPMRVAKMYETFLTMAHGKFINSDEINEGMKFINTAVMTDHPDEGFERYSGVLVPYEVKSNGPIGELNVIKIYRAGFIL